MMEYPNVVSKLGLENHPKDQPLFRRITPTQLKASGADRPLLYLKQQAVLLFLKAFPDDEVNPGNFKVFLRYKDTDGDTTIIHTSEDLIAALEEYTDVGKIKILAQVQMKSPAPLGYKTKNHVEKVTVSSDDDSSTSSYYDDHPLQITVKGAGSGDMFDKIKILAQIQDKSPASLRWPSKSLAAKWTECSDDCHPLHIIVQGAGCPVVNGVYRRDGHVGHCRKYTKPGKLAAIDSTFHILQSNLSTNVKRWFISAVPSGRQPGTNTDIDFYRAEAKDGCLRTPPRTGWLPMKGDYGPSPSLFFVDGRV